MEFEKLDKLPHEIDKFDTVTYKQCGRVLSAVYSSKRSSGCNIKKIDKDRYINLSTGEVKNFKHGDSRIDNVNTIRQSLSRLRDYINTNVYNPKFCKWVTLTYAENMTDTQRLYTDFDKFIKRLRYAYGNFEYIVAMEPQGRGAWHAHLLLIFSKVAPFIPNAELAQIWGNGFTKTKNLDNIDNVGAYLTAYLGDLEFNDTNASLLPAEVLQGLHVATKAKKKIIKGGRMYLYPVGFNLYRCSRGISSPTIEQISERQLQQRVVTAKQTYSKIIRLHDDVANVDFWLYYRYYLLPKFDKEVQRT